MKAHKWNFKNHKYEEIEIPDEAEFYSTDMGLDVKCAQCGIDMIYGFGYTSRRIHTAFGFGYTVCESCYTKELKEDGWDGNHL